ncbi:MAG: GDP-mannose 4,6-dehydratase [Acidimicrobiia bacterium]
MRSLITGADGFVGRHLARHLRDEGDDVVEIDVHGAGELDITDREALIAHVGALMPDAIYHLAARSHVGESWGRDSDVVRVNVHGTANVLDAARAANVHRVVVVGSSEQYGVVAPHEIPLTERAPLRPVSPYAQTKTEAEALALRAAADGLGVICVRAFSHTGPGQSPRFLVPAIAARVVAAELVGGDHEGSGTIAVGRTDPVRDFSDVRDVVRAYRSLVLRGEPGEVYNVCSGIGVTVGDLVSQVLALATTPLELVVDPALVRDTDVPVLIGDHTRITSATGWRPQIPLHQTLHDVLAHTRGQVT